MSDARVIAFSRSCQSFFNSLLILLISTDWPNE